MRKCCVKGCNYPRGDSEKISLHGLFVKGQFLDDWLRAIQLLNKQSMDKACSKGAKICSEHFEKKYVVDYGGHNRIMPGAVPTIFPGVAKEEMENVEFLTFSPGSQGNETINSLSTVEPMERPSSPSHLLTKGTPIGDENFNSLNTVEPEERPSCSSHSLLTEGTRRVTSGVKRSYQRYPGDVDIEHPTPRRIRRYSEQVTKMLKAKNSVIKNMQRQIKRKDSKIQSLRSVITELRNKHILSENAAQVLSSYDNSVLKNLSEGKIIGKYPVALRSFALTLHFYSPRAYNYVRSLFRKNLPAPSTLRSWYSSNSISAGFTFQSVEILKIKTISQQRQDRKLVACLMMDEMAVRKHIEWDHAQKKFVGVIDYGTDICTDADENLPLAKEALVFLLVGLNSAWKLPVGYFLTNGLNSIEKANLTQQIINYLRASNVEIVGLTFDGHPSNIGMTKRLGTNLNNFEPCFKSQDIDKPIFIFVDACHCLKLIRNTWASKGILRDENGQDIKWEYIEKLVKYQNELGLHFANKLSNKHINWRSKIMNVKLAAQTLSESTACALLFLLNEGVEDFVGCEATILFIRTVNNIFDCLNSKSKFGRQFKKGLCSENKDRIFKFFDDSIRYLSGLTLNNEKIITSKNKMGFVGFIIDMKNLKKLFNKYVEEDKVLEYILSYKLSQDHLELFFSSIRSRGGFNNNPTCAQFASAYKRLLIHNEVRSSAEANCMVCDDTNILTVSSSKSKEEDSAPQVDDKDLVVFADIDLEKFMHSPFDEVVTYISGFVEHQIIKTINCPKCKEFIINSRKEQSKFISIKTKGFLRNPHKDTLKICRIVQRTISLYEVQNQLRCKNMYNRIVCSTLRNLDVENIYIELNSHLLDLDPLENHKYFLIKLIIEKFSKVILHYYEKKTNVLQHKELVRNKFTKLVQFLGQ